MSSGAGKRFFGGAAKDLSPAPAEGATTATGWTPGSAKAVFPTSATRSAPAKPALPALGIVWEKQEIGTMPPPGPASTRSQPFTKPRLLNGPPSKDLEVGADMGAGAGAGVGSDAVASAGTSAGHTEYVFRVPVSGGGAGATEAAQEAPANFETTFDVDATVDALATVDAHTTIDAHATDDATEDAHATVPLDAGAPRDVAAPDELMQDEGAGADGYTGASVYDSAAQGGASGAPASAEAFVNPAHAAARGLLAATVEEALAIIAAARKREKESNDAPWSECKSRLELLPRALLNVETDLALATASWLAAACIKQPGDADMPTRLSEYEKKLTELGL